MLADKSWRLWQSGVLISGWNEWTVVQVPPALNRCLALRIRQCAWLDLFRATVVVRPRVCGNRDRAAGKKLVRFRRTNETSVSVVNQEPTGSCGMGPQAPKDRIQDSFLILSSHVHAGLLSMFITSRFLTTVLGHL